MNILKLSAKNLSRNRLTTFLNVVLVAFGVGILSILFLASTQIGNKLESNSKDIDLVVGAKGSPLQLILSSIYHIDFPTGNIPAEDAQELMNNPMVKRAVPLGLGDNYQGYRIVGTDTSFIGLYGLKLNSGRFWKADLEATLGFDAARELKLKVGDKFYGAHGLSDASDEHKDHAYLVTGILSPQGNVTDNLILTNMGSIYQMHEPEQRHEVSKIEKPGETAGREITALLIQYRSPMSVVIFPRLVNQSTNMQAASPAMESARLFSLIGVGVETLKWFAILIMGISAFSVFISMYNAMKEKKYDLAILRCLGASKSKVFFLVMLEGLLITIIGALFGLVIGHLALSLIGHYQESSQAKLTGIYFVADELYLILAGIGIGVVAAIIPALQTYQVDIAKTLSKDK
ncbi:ABC transporter permease [Pedobacter sandarakinus]|uniref:ABC transporter permease n=1 Tax=Pedobacter sandarakinus TaxID=353156 RepID=UPI00224537FA|nr:FtsX-like permease family protein [Pedobacter sandarakinus]MCX2574427.1 ABC transporter permease [Pedobacter sandarakinus]